MTTKQKLVSLMDEMKELLGDMEHATDGWFNGSIRHDAEKIRAIADEIAHMPLDDPEEVID